MRGRGTTPDQLDDLAEPLRRHAVEVAGHELVDQVLQHIGGVPSEFAHELELFEHLLPCRIEVALEEGLKLVDLVGPVDGALNAVGELAELRVREDQRNDLLEKGLGPVGAVAPDAEELVHAVLGAEVLVADHDNDEVGRRQPRHELADQVARAHLVAIALDLDDPRQSGAEIADQLFALPPFGRLVAPGVGDEHLRIPAGESRRRWGTEDRFGREVGVVTRAPGTVWPRRRGARLSGPLGSASRRERIDDGAEVGIAEQVIAHVDALSQPVGQPLVARSREAQRDPPAAVVEHLLLQQGPAARRRLVGPDAVLPVDAGLARSLAHVADQRADQPRVEERVVVRDPPSLLIGYFVPPR